MRNCRVQSEKEVTFREIGHEGELMSIDSWLEATETKDLVDFDGFGYWAKEEEYSDLMVKPTDWTLRKINPPTWATHVYWLNK